MKLKNSSTGLIEDIQPLSIDMLKKVGPNSTGVKDFKPKPKKSPEVMAMESISWQLKRIADVLESNND